MAFRSRSSRQRFDEFRQQLYRRLKGGQSPAVDESSDRTTTPKNRSFWGLLAELWRLLGANRWTLLIPLSTVAIATLLKLVPPAVTKLVIDYVLPGKPLPGRLPTELHLPPDSMKLLAIFAGGVLAISLVSTAVSLWGRLLATIVMKRVQVNVRRRVFDMPAIAAPSHLSTQERRSVQHPARRCRRRRRTGIQSALQPLASDCPIAWQSRGAGLGRLRLLAGSLVFLPAVYLSHRTWIGRI